MSNSYRSIETTPVEGLAMRTSGSILGSRVLGLGFVGGLSLWGLSLISSPQAPAAGTTTRKADPVAVGREIFNREWLPGDSRSHGGDGLGPVYNDTSCVACHNSGGPGGGGPISKNIDILSASSSFSKPMAVQINTTGQPQPPQTGSTSQPLPSNPFLASDAHNKELFDLHPGFRTGRTVVLHKFGIDPNYQAWRQKATTSRSSDLSNQQMPMVNGRTVSEPFEVTMTVTESPVGASQATPTDSTVITNVAQMQNPPQIVPVPQAPARPFQFVRSIGNNPSMARAQARLQETLAMMASRSKPQFQAGEALVSHSQRNATALFGIGLIDDIPESAILAKAGQPNKQFPEIVGRASRLKNGRVGRFGWKGQTASVEEFVLTACAVELGLEVPGHEQALSPQAPKYRADGQDLTGDECSSLVAYVRSIPRPAERKPALESEVEAVASGKALFASVGCAACHTPSLGNVEGVYSDLLLHDMGADLGDSGSYNGDPDDSDPLNPVLGDPQADAQVQQSPEVTNQLATASLGNNPGGNARLKALSERPATRQEWRTPPLWGFRDSAPYLHDGRAETLEQAVAGHGGQGQATALRYFELSTKERAQLEAFMKSLVAPGTAGIAVASE